MIGKLIKLKYESNKGLLEGVGYVYSNGVKNKEDEINLVGVSWKDGGTSTLMLSDLFSYEIIEL